MATIMGGLVLTPAVFNPKPVAQGAVSTTQVTEGCVPGNGQVEFTHSDSFHPNSDARITTYYWDANQADGLWWETGANPDLDINGNALRTTEPLDVLTYVYNRRGTYVPTLRVEDNSGLTKSVKRPSPKSQWVLQLTFLHLLLLAVHILSRSEITWNSMALLQMVTLPVVIEPQSLGMSII